MALRARVTLFKLLLLPLQQVSLNNFEAFLCLLLA